MITREEIVGVGKFQKTHGLKGELNLISDIDPDYYKEGRPLIVPTEGIYVPYFVETIRPKGSTTYLVKLVGIDSEDDASEFINKEIYILKKDAESWLNEELISTEDIIGFKIIKDEIEIGEIIGIEDSTSNILFIVRRPDNSEVFIPANEDFILNINEEDKTILMNLPNGLLDINTKK